MAYRFALITGASSGIGEAFARILPATCELFLTGRDEDRLAKLAAELESAERPVRTLAADLAQEAGRRALLEAAAALPVDLLVNNAGLGLFGDLQTNPVAREREMVEVNCLAPVLLTRALLPDMLARANSGGQRAGIIVVASTAAFFTLPRLTTYAASKAFDLHFALGLAGELNGQPVDVLALCPGPTRTAFFRRAELSDMGHLARHGPEQVAREGLDALGRRPVHVVGGGNRLAAMATRLVPRPIMMRVGVEWSKRRKRREAAQA